YGDLKLSEAFAIADNVLAKAARGIAEIITVHGYINVDFADVETVMANSGVAMMGSGEAEGENRAAEAIEAAVSSPLLNSNDITGAKSILLNISSGVNEISMDEVGEITDYINSTVIDDVMIIWGTCQDETLGNKVSITIIATGFETSSIPELYLTPRSLEKVVLKESDQQTPLVNPDFEIKDTEMSSYTIDEYDHSQKTIDFSVTDNLDEAEGSEFISKLENELEIDQHKTSERIRKIKEHQNYLKDQGYLEKDKKDEIEELENQPAYIRKNRKISKSGYSTIRKVSKYSLFDDDENETKLGSDNSYLHDNVD
ncbi:MAG: cell division protein FtsZ, partial [Bacteroidetes bacterium]